MSIARVEGWHMSIDVARLRRELFGANRIPEDARGQYRTQLWEAFGAPSKSFGWFLVEVVPQSAKCKHRIMVAFQGKWFPIGRLFQSREFRSWVENCQILGVDPFNYFAPGGEASLSWFLVNLQDDSHYPLEIVQAESIEEALEGARGNVIHRADTRVRLLDMMSQAELDNTRNLRLNEVAK